MQFRSTLFFALGLAFTSLTFAKPLADSSPAALFERSNPNCGWPNGNCYDNGCDGDKSSDGITCTAGEYAGCECGYGCGSSTGLCDENGCDGVNGRCTASYKGCSCLE
ncbi:MAG: hypothetical protein M1834_001131 [Cirrosporium novae-zelandiae]|nr:MAG: hypothetical protein M1834_001131 [Cirrosporium novae-zelandiae]